VAARTPAPVELQARWCPDQRATSSLNNAKKKINSKFDHSFYSKIYTKYHFFLLCLASLIKILQKLLKFDYVCTIFLN